VDLNSNLVFLSVTSVSESQQLILLMNKKLFCHMYLILW